MSPVTPGVTGAFGTQTEIGRAAAAKQRADASGIGPLFAKLRVGGTSCGMSLRGLGNAGEGRLYRHSKADKLRQRIVTLVRHPDVSAGVERNGEGFEQLRIAA